MTSLSEIIFYSVISAAILLCVLGLWLTAIVPGIDRWSKRFFLQYFSVFLLCCLLGFFDMAVAWHSFSNKAFYFYTILECVVLALPLPMLTVYLLHCCGENPRRSRLLRAVFVLLAVYYLVLVSAVFVEGYISVAPDGNMTYGPLYPLVLLPPIAIMLLNLAGTIRRRKQNSRKTFLSLVIAQMTMAGMMREAETSTRSEKITSSHLASVLLVTFIISGTSHIRHNLPANHASRKASTTKMA